MHVEYVNLLPDSFRARQLWRARASKWTLLAVGAVLLLLGYSLLLGRNVTAVKRELVPLEKQVAEKEELTQKLAELEKELQRAVEKQDTLNKVLDQRDWACVFADIAVAARDNAWLERIRLTKVKLRRKRDNPAGSDRGEQEEEEEVIQVKFSANGYAHSNFDLANFMTKLEKSRHFDDVELNYSELTEANRIEDLIEFEIDGALL